LKEKKKTADVDKGGGNPELVKNKGEYGGCSTATKSIRRGGVKNRSGETAQEGVKDSGVNEGKNKSPARSEKTVPAPFMGQRGTKSPREGE